LKQEHDEVTKKFLQLSNPTDFGEPCGVNRRQTSYIFRNRS